MNLPISETNKLWLEKTAKHFQVPPEALLGLILDRLRQQSPQDTQQLTDWIDAPAKGMELSGELLEELRVVGRDADAAVKATRLYLSLIETNKKK